MKTTSDKEIKKDRSEKNDLNQELLLSRQALLKAYLQKNCSNEQVPLKMFIRNIEKDTIVYALRLANGNQRTASFILGIKPSTLNEKIKNLRIDEFGRKNRKLTKSEILERIDFSSI